MFSIPDPQMCMGGFFFFLFAHRNFLDGQHCINTCFLWWALTAVQRCTFSAWSDAICHTLHSSPSAPGLHCWWRTLQYELEIVNILLMSLFAEYLAFLSVLPVVHVTPGCRTTYLRILLELQCETENWSLVHVKNKITQEAVWIHLQLGSAAFQKCNGRGCFHILHVILEEMQRTKEHVGFLRAAHQKPSVRLCVFSVYRESVSWHTVVMENLTWRFSVYLKKCPFKPQAITSKFAKLLPYRLQKLPFAPSGVP